MGTSSCSTTDAIGPRKRAETTPAPWNWPSTTTILVARKVWEYRHDPDLYAVNRSSAYRLENGNTLLNFVTDPRVVVEVAPDGTELFKANISGPRMQGSFRAYAIDSVMGETRVTE